MTSRFRPALIALAAAVVGAAALSAQQARPGAGPTNDDLLAGLKNPNAWLMAGGTYEGTRHSPLTQITPDNVASLVPVWTFQTETIGRTETTTLLYDNILYATGSNNFAWAIDARTGRQIWRYRRELPPRMTYCCGPVNRGFAILGDLLYMTTLDAHLIALDRRTGNLVWDATLEDYATGYAATVAPQIVKDKVIVGVAGAEYGIRGFLDAYNVKTGERVWRFYTVPGPGEPGHDTWGGDSWKTGGASIWQTGTYDPELNLVFWGTGNPGPDYHSDSRPGDNLYSDTLLALDPDTGKLRWHYQFTPHDTHDWDAVHVPILGEMAINGKPRKVVMNANRNGFFYTLDRATGEVLTAKPFINTTWAKEIGKDGRPVLLPNNTPDEKGTTTCPDLVGGTNFNPPSFDPTQKLFFVAARETCAIYYAWKPEYRPGDSFTGGAIKGGVGGSEKNYGAIRAIDPATGERKWEFRLLQPGNPGIMTTASGLLFTGDTHGNLLALDSRSGKLLWNYQMGSNLHGTAPTTYMLDGRQILLVPSGQTLTAWALPDVARKPATQP